ncbi:MAG TPA: lysophospholipid acyltransferase family protein [Steroidobacteraceae bacterium]|nr:lysophospholipid acyltransferase family protein [Steroidobacteraceae bacterium]
MRNLLTWPFRVVYGTYCWTTFLIFGVLALALMLVVPGMERRRRIARRTGRIAFAFMGIRLRTEGLEQLPAERCIVVANHASYLDGAVLMSTLPPRFAFVIKKEMDRIPLASHLLRRIGSAFVDRRDRHKSAMDARRVLRRANQGESLVFFPEGTFSRQPGLLRFHTGAFATAVRAGCAVVPVVIRGTRHVLPSHRVAPRPGSITVQMLAVLQPVAGDAEASAHLRDEARRILLAHLGEPDLAEPTSTPLLGETA